MVNSDDKMVFTEEEKNNLFLKNENLIHSISYKFASNTVGHEDLFGEASIGFTKALNTFDPNMKTKFTTYDYTCMEKQILSFMRGDTKRHSPDSYLNI